MAFDPIHDDPDTQVERWEKQQARKAGLTVKEWREKQEKERQAVQLEAEARKRGAKSSG